MNARSLARDIFQDEYDFEKKRDVNRILYEYQGLYWDKVNDTEWTLVSNTPKKTSSSEHEHQREKRLWSHKLLSAILLHDEVTLFDFDQRELNIMQKVVIDGERYTEIAAEYGLSVERIRQIHIGSFERLRSGIIEMLDNHRAIKDYSERMAIDYKAILQENRILRKQMEDARQILAIGLSKPSQTNDDQDLLKPLNELDLSVRALNCLAKSNILTVGDLMKKSIHDLLQIEQFGKTTLKEVIQELKSMGLTLKE